MVTRMLFCNSINGGSISGIMINILNGMILPELVYILIKIEAKTHPIRSFERIRLAEPNATQPNTHTRFETRM